MACPRRRVRGGVSRTVCPWGRMRGGVSGNGVSGPPCPVALGPGGSARWRRTQVRPRFGVPRFAPSPSATSGFPVTEVTRGGRAARPVRRAWRVFLDGRRVACDASRGVAEEPLPPPLPPDARSQPRAGGKRATSASRVLVLFSLWPLLTAPRGDSWPQCPHQTRKVWSPGLRPVSACDLVAASASVAG